MTSVSWGDKLRFEAAAHRSYDLNQKGGKGEEHCSVLTHSEILELFELARIKYLRFFLDLLVLDEPLVKLLPSRKPRVYRG